MLLSWAFENFFVASHSTIWATSYVPIPRYWPPPRYCVVLIRNSYPQQDNLSKLFQLQFFTMVVTGRYQRLQAEVVLGKSFTPKGSLEFIHSVFEFLLPNCPIETLFAYFDALEG